MQKVLIMKIQYDIDIGRRFTLNACKHKMAQTCTVNTSGKPVLVTSSERNDRVQSSLTKCSHLLNSIQYLCSTCIKISISNNETQRLKSTKKEYWATVTLYRKMRPQRGQTSSHGAAKFLGMTNRCCGWNFWRSIATNESI